MKITGLFKNHYPIPRFLINSLPKSGTHLIEKAVQQFPGITVGPAMNNIWAQRHGTAIGADDSVLVGVDWPHPASVAAIRRIFRSLKNGQYVLGHIPFSETVVKLLAEQNMKSLLILRDPRDVIVSFSNYVGGHEQHFLFKQYQPLSQSERLMKAIVGIEQSSPDQPMLLDVGERCRSLVGWMSQPFNYVTYFEKLVGPQGGGSKESQLMELQNIAHHLGLRCDSSLEQIANQVFGGTTTFRKGTIGSWHTNFSSEHKRAFKERAGQTLIDFGYEDNFDW
jgi:hypothetical protein